MESPRVELREVMSLDLDSVRVDPAETYDMVGVYSFGQGLFRREPVSGSNTSYKFFYRLKPDHIVMSQLFGWEGALALSSQEFAGLYVSPQFPTFSCNPGKLDRRFLGWFVRMPSFWDDLGTRTRGMGDRRRTLNPEALLSSLIPFPPLDEQRRIVSHIEELAAKVEEVHGLRRAAAIEADAVTNSALAKIVAKLKERVGCRSLGEVIDGAGYGTSKKCEPNRLKNSFPVLRIPNVASERVNLENLKYAQFSEAELERVLLVPGDVLVVRTNGSIDLVGRSAVVPDLPEKVAFASYLIRIRCNTEIIWPSYFQMMLKHLRTNGNLIDFARTTAGQYNVSLGRLRAAELPVPSLDDQRNIVAYVDDLQSKVNSVRELQTETAAEVDALMPSILSKAFRGEL